MNECVNANLFQTCENKTKKSYFSLTNKHNKMKSMLLHVFSPTASPQLTN